MTRPLLSTAFLLLASLSLAGCHGEPLIDADVVDSPPAPGYHFTSLDTLIDLFDYQGRYGLMSELWTGFSSHTTTLSGKAQDYERDTYSDVDEEGILELLIFQPKGDETYNGRTVYTFQQHARFPEFGCDITMEGEARETYSPDDPYYYYPHYDFFGTTHLDCPGAELTLESQHHYNDPGELVGYVAGDFRVMEDEAGDGSE